MRNDVKVVIPSNVLKLTELGGMIVSKNQQEGVNSPIKGVDMVKMEEVLQIAKTQMLLANKLQLNAQTATQKRNIALGMGQKQATIIEDSVIYFITSIRDFLKGQFRGEEQKLGDWGFLVNQNKKGGVRIVIPYRKVLELIALGKQIVAKHNTDGAQSKINQFGMARLIELLEIAEQQHALSKELMSKKEIAVQDRNIALGLGRKKDSSKKGTLRFYIISVRDTLLGLNRQETKNLGEWGFEVNDSSKKNKE